jgi:hypothetical protein
VLAWLLGAPAVAAPIIGPRTLDQLEDLLGVTEKELNNKHPRALQEPATTRDLSAPHAAWADRPVGRTVHASRRSSLGSTDTGRPHAVYVGAVGKGGRLVRCKEGVGNTAS